MDVKKLEQKRLGFRIIHIRLRLMPQKPILEYFYVPKLLLWQRHPNDHSGKKLPFFTLKHIALKTVVFVNVIPGITMIQ